MLLDGYVYVKDGVIVSKTYWKCKNFASCKCRARVYTEADSMVKYVGDHNHAAEVTRMEAMDKWMLSMFLVNMNMLSPVRLSVVCLSVICRL